MIMTRPKPWTPRPGDPPVRVHAVMITGKCPERRAMARVAAECFMGQTYPNRRLVIVNHGGEPLKVQVRQNPGDHHVGCDEVMVSRRDYPTLGDLRNQALDLCFSGLVCVWDDDDWMAPDYMATLVANYSPGCIVLMKEQIRHDLVRDTSYVARSANGHYGQALYPAETRHRYPPRDKHEDAEFSHQFCHHRVVLDNDPRIYVRTCHDHNTWHRDHIMGKGLARRTDTHLLTPAQLELVREVRKLYLPGQDAKEAA